MANLLKFTFHIYKKEPPPFVSMTHTVLERPNRSPGYGLPVGAWGSIKPTGPTPLKAVWENIPGSTVQVHP